MAPCILDEYGSCKPDYAKELDSVDRHYRAILLEHKQIAKSLLQ